LRDSGLPISAVDLPKTALVGTLRAKTAIWAGGAGQHLPFKHQQQVSERDTISPGFNAGFGNRALSCHPTYGF
jgi:hypothetical protein